MLFMYDPPELWHQPSLHDPKQVLLVTPLVRCMPTKSVTYSVCSLCNQLPSNKAIQHYTKCRLQHHSRSDPAYPVCGWPLLFTPRLQYCILLYSIICSTLIQVKHSPVPEMQRSIQRIVRWVASSIRSPVTRLLTTSSNAMMMSAPILF